ncbi:MAG: hypothetical protein HKP53_02550 [Eudoraea sp.]|nr:hypothetical protein [Eudoraea sp.]
MEVTKKSKTSRVKWLWNIVRHGLILHGITNRLEKIGIDIDPYYWVQEGISGYSPPEIRGDTSEFSIKYLNLEEVTQTISRVSGFRKQEILDGFRNGQLCVGLIHQKECAAFMFIELNDFELKKRTFKLADNEAYLLNMWTFDAYRGMNIAPYLRYQCYLLLNEMGRDTTFSISDYFNKSSIKFKKKLNAKHLKLYLYVGLFKKYHWNFELKDYSK